MGMRRKPKQAGENPRKYFTTDVAPGQGIIPCGNIGFSVATDIKSKLENLLDCAMNVVAMHPCGCGSPSCSLCNLEAAIEEVAKED